MTHCSKTICNETISIILHKKIVIFILSSFNVSKNSKKPSLFVYDCKKNMRFLALFITSPCDII